ncbi:MAG: 4-hydroxyphenylpyruvate dioxygenase [Planctomycetota bacterium]
MTNPLPLERIHHVELLVGNAKQAAYFYRKCFGFDQIAYRGPETGCRDRASYVVGSSKIRLVLTTPLSAEDPSAQWLRRHADGVCDIAFEVKDVDEVFAEATGRGAEAALPPEERRDASGAVRVAAIRTFGDVVHSFVARADYGGVFLPGFAEDHRPGGDTGLLVIDHIVGNVEERRMDYWARWYERVLGWHPFVSYDDKDISTEYSALRSKVMASPDRAIKFPINEPAPGRRKSQIQEYLDFNLGPGVQHLAFLTGDILSTVRRLRGNGLEFLDVPDSYYEKVWDRVGPIDEDRGKVRELRLLVDRDETGYLLQTFTQPLQDRPTLFIEIIQRRGCQSFGKGNFKALFESIERAQARRGNL